MHHSIVDIQQIVHSFLADFPLKKQPSFFSYSLSSDTWLCDSTIVLSVSGGQTSMMMAGLLKAQLPFHNIVCIFANTGCENDETLDFIHQCDKAFGLNVIWIEAVTNPEHGKGVTHRLTDYENAYRARQYKELDHPFHAHIRKNGIPNMSRPQCSDRLKEAAIEHYKKIHNLKGAPHSLGMRADEPLRVMPKSIRNILDNIDTTLDDFLAMEHQTRLNTYTSSAHGYWAIESGDDAEYQTFANYCGKLRKYNLHYLLSNAWCLDKQDVQTFWEEMPFRLALEEHQGNCQTCWKKSDKKLFLLAHEDGQNFEAFAWFEATYANVKPQGIGNVFFRKNRSSDMIMGEAALLDKHTLRKMVIKSHGHFDAPNSDGCGSSCESYNIAV
jgi:hypothetical protein